MARSSAAKLHDRSPNWSTNSVSTRNGDGKSVLANSSGTELLRSSSRNDVGTSNAKNSVPSNPSASRDCCVPTARVPSLKFRNKVLSPRIDTSPLALTTRRAFAGLSTRSTVPRSALERSVTVPFASTLNLAGVALSMRPGVRALGGGGPAGRAPANQAQRYTTISPDGRWLYWSG